MDIACGLRPDANIGFNTNGVLLNEEVCCRMVDVGLKHLVVSLNMPDKESYKKFSGKDFFDIIVKNLKILRRVKTEKNSKWPVVILQFLNAPPVLGNENKLRDDWDELYDNIFFRNIAAPGVSKDKLAELKDKIIDIPVTQIIRPAAVPCASMMVTCGIDWLGYYVPCCRLCMERSFVGKRKYKYMELGHVNDIDVQTAWRSAGWGRLRAEQIAGLLRVCNDCTSNQVSHARLQQYADGILSYCYNK